MLFGWMLPCFAILGSDFWCYIWILFRAGTIIVALTVRVICQASLMQLWSGPDIIRLATARGIPFMTDSAGRSFIKGIVR